MKTSACLLLVLALSSVFILHPSTLLQASAVGTAFTYQGHLSDGGQPANGLFDLRFAIHDAAESGAQIGMTITNSLVTVTNGLFTVALDFGEGVFTGDARWLDVAVRRSGSPADFVGVVPRQPLTPFPFALYATQAGVAASANAVSGSVDASQISGLISPDNIMAGSITTAMIAPGAVGADQLAPDAVGNSALADGAVSLAKLNTSQHWLMKSAITNPTPAYNDLFGSHLTRVSEDKLLVGVPSEDTGATDAGTAYLFTTTGNLLVTFTNPAPAPYDRFGLAVTAIDVDKLAIAAPESDLGAVDSGAVHVFRTNGTLLTTITNPTPESSDYFGHAVAGLGADRLLIGASGKDLGAPEAGAAYLFRTDGVLLATITNPSPNTTRGEYFGSVLTVLEDKLVISSQTEDYIGPPQVHHTGVVYVFNTNGILLTTITNPAPADNDRFGLRLAAVGTDKLLIGSPFDDAGAPDAGSAYLFASNGALLATFNNPTPEAGDLFGSALAAIDADKVLIGASGDNTTGPRAGAAYLYRLDGTLLASLTKPGGSANDNFGAALAVVGGALAIGVASDDTGEVNAGAVCCFAWESSYLRGLAGDGVLPGSVTSASLADAAVTSSKLSNAAVTGSHIATGTISYLHLAPGAVTSEKILDGTVASADIADGSITVADLSPSLVTDTFWRLGGNTGTTYAQFLGTTDYHPLTFKVGGAQALFLEPMGDSTFDLDTTPDGAPSVTGGSHVNYALAPGATISGGGAANIDGQVASNRVYSCYGSVGGGLANYIGSLGAGANIAGGIWNGMSDSVAYSAIGGGFRNRIESISSGSTIAGGVSNVIGNNCYSSTVGGGLGNTIHGNSACATIPGGRSNTATNYAFAAGHRAKANHTGTFVWADSQNADFASSGANQFLVRAAGGVGVNTTSPQTALDVNGTVRAQRVIVTSDRAAKENFAPVDGRQILSRLAAVPIQTWSYKDAAGTRHLGPVAQDFFAAFGVGADDKHIATVDADGVALAAIQALHQMLQDREDEIRMLNQRLAALESVLTTRQTVARAQPVGEKVSEPDLDVETGN